MCVTFEYWLKITWHHSIRLPLRFHFHLIIVRLLWKNTLTLHPSHVNAPKWKPAAGSPHTLHSWFIYEINSKNSVPFGTLHSNKNYKYSCGMNAWILQLRMKDGHPLFWSWYILLIVNIKHLGSKSFLLGDNSYHYPGNSGNYLKSRRNTAIAFSSRR